MSNFSKLIDRYDRYFLYYLEKIILSFDKPTRKFYIDMIYGILKCQSIILSDIAHTLNEHILPKKTIERLSRFLDRPFDINCRNSFLKKALSLMPKDLKVFSVDDTDVIKPYGNKFESLGKVKDGSSIKERIEKGYRVSCITAISSYSKHPIPVYDIFHSEIEKGFKSVNNYTLDGLKLICSQLKEYEGLFIFDRGYDDNKIINFFKLNKQYFIIRMTKNRKIITNQGKKLMIEEGQKRKGKISLITKYKGDSVEIKASSINVKLINDNKEYSLVYAFYDNSKEPAMFLTNKKIDSKEDIIRTILNYVSRWKIEEQFRFKKNALGFEDFRVRTLNRINNLTICLDIAIGYMVYLIENNSDLYQNLITISKHLKGDEAYLKFYQLLSGIKTLLGHKEMGIKNKEKIEHRNVNKQLTLF